MLTDRGWIATAFGLRAFDLGMWAIRLGIAASILGIDLPTGDVLLLAITALVVSLNPLGRLGWREAAVAILAARLAAPGLGARRNSTRRSNNWRCWRVPPRHRSRSRWESSPSIWWVTEGSSGAFEPTIFGPRRPRLRPPPKPPRLRRWATFPGFDRC